MRHLFTFLFLTLGLQIAEAQEPYRSFESYTSLPFVSEGKSWDIHRWVYENSFYYNDHYFLSGDTLLNDKKCMKLYMTTDQENFPSAIYPQHEVGFYRGALYEEDGKVYMVSSSNNSVALLYDISLVAGSEGKVNGTTVKVQSVDTLFLAGCYRKVMIVRTWVSNGNYFDEPWVEGIGGPNPFNPVSQGKTGGRVDFVGYAENGQTLFNSEDFEALQALAKEGERVKFVEDGKVWTYLRTAPPAYMHFFSLFIQGDTILDGKECKKLYGDHYDYHVPYEPICFLGGLYEEEGKVYLVDNVYNTTDQWFHQLLYDFSHQVGDTFTVDNDRYHLKLVEIREGEVHHGQDYKVHVFQWDSDRDGWHWGYKYVTWIEGIGSTYQDLFEVCPIMGKYGFLTSVTLNGDTLYYRDIPEVYKEMLTVKHVTTDESQLSDKKYDLSGRQIKEARKSQIIIRDGRKFILR